MKLKRIVTTFLAAMSVLLVAGCGATADIPKGPNYRESNSNSHSFEAYAYSSVSDGMAEMNGLDWYCGESFITLEQFKYLKECGFTAIMPQSTAVAGTAVLDDVLRLALQAGLKVIITDNRIYQGTSETPMMVYNTLYNSEAALDQAVKGWLDDYWDHPAYWGVMFDDEPGNAILNGSYGDLYKSVRRVYDNNGHSDKFIFANTMAMSTWSGYTEHGENPERWTEISNEKYCEILGDEFTTNAAKFANDQEGFWNYVNEYVSAAGGMRDEYQCGIMRARFEAFMRTYFEKTGADHVAIDWYPLYSSGPMTHMIASLQIASMVANEFNAELHVVSQTMTYVPYGSTSERLYTEEDMRFVNDMMLGFGVKEISYFTYFVHGDDNKGYFLEQSSFMTWYGEKTQLWYIMQKIMADNQKFANTIKNFQYQTSRMYKKQVSGYGDALEYIDYGKDMGNFKVLRSVETDQSSAVVTELYDAKKKNYMYMIQNVVDSQWRTADTYQTATLTFTDKYDYAVIWVNGETKEVALKDHQLVVENPAGQATFIIPYAG